MIRFQCPACQKTLKTSDGTAGQKIFCPSCGQRLMVPPPIKDRSKTVIGRALPSDDDKLASPSLPSGRIEVDCPGCGSRFTILEEASGRWVDCPKCGTGFAALSDESLTNDSGSEQLDYRESAHAYTLPVTDFPGKKHSALGIASFMIALIVGSLDVILAVVIATGIAHSSPRGSADLRADMMAGSMAMVCFYCMSLPACIAGVGLAGVGLAAHRDRNHFFTLIGLIGNGVVILGLAGLYLLGAMSGK